MIRVATAISVLALSSPAFAVGTNASYDMSGNKVGVNWSVKRILSQDRRGGLVTVLAVDDFGNERVVNVPRSDIVEFPQGLFSLLINPEDR